MSSTIDWSKAPEWAGAVISARYGTQFWAEQFGEASKRQRLDNQPDTGIATFPTDHGWTLVETRPTESPAWNGEGLPPVGTVCEIYWGANSWRECTVFAHKPNGNGGIDALVDLDGDWTFGNKFRPIRTPEQTAAEARAIEILEIERIAVTGENSGQHYAAAIYDAGYRKVEQP